MVPHGGQLVRTASGPHLTTAPWPQHNAIAANGRLARLRLADDVVMAYEVSVLPHTILADPEAVGDSLYRHLESIGKAPVRALQHIRAINASAGLARQLGVPEGQAVLYITRLAGLESGQAMELTHSYCHGDHYDFVAEMRRAT